MFPIMPYDHPTVSAYDPIPKPDVVKSNAGMLSIVRIDSSPIRNLKKRKYRATPIPMSASSLSKTVEGYIFFFQKINNLYLGSGQIYVFLVHHVSCTTYLIVVLQMDDFPPRYTELSKNSCARAVDGGNHFVPSNSSL